VTQEARGHFDIHQYAGRVMNTLEKRAPQPEAPLPFRDLVERGTAQKWDTLLCGHAPSGELRCTGTGLAG